MGSTRREFLGSAAASSALIALYGPSSAFAASTSDDVAAAAKTLDALARVPTNNLPTRDWASVAEREFAKGAASQREAFAALRGVKPDFAKLSPSQANEELARLLLPGYSGPQRMPAEQWSAQLEAQSAAIANAPKHQVPADTGTFTGAATPISQAARTTLTVKTSAADLKRSRIALRAVEAASGLAATTAPRSDDGARNGLAVGF